MREITLRPGTTSGAHLGRSTNGVSRHSVGDRDLRPGAHRHSEGIPERLGPSAGRVVCLGVVVVQRDRHGRDRGLPTSRSCAVDGSRASTSSRSTGRGTAQSRCRRWRSTGSYGLMFRWSGESVRAATTALWTRWHPPPAGPLPAPKQSVRRSVLGDLSADHVDRDSSHVVLDLPPSRLSAAAALGGVADDRVGVRLHVRRRV